MTNFPPVRYMSRPICLFLPVIRGAATKGLDGERVSGGESSKRKGEGSEGHHPLARSAAKESGDTEPEGVALALEREVRR
jgi:hypothetical protein